MAKIKITAEQAMEKELGDTSKNDASAHVYASAEAQAKIRSKVKRKYLESDEKYEERLAKKREQYERKLNVETAAEKKAQAEKEYKESVTKLDKLKAIGKSVGASAVQAMQNVVSNTTKGIDQYLGVYAQYMSDIETRLQGSGKTFKSITNLISSGIGMSPYVSQKAVLENLSRLVKSGISYNVEQRALLETVADRIAATFDSFDSNLMRIIRIQQSDSTTARLGMESILTKFLNAKFQDTSYLKDLSKAVSGELLQAGSTLDKNQAVEFEYAVQKWLGSLASVGTSNRTIQQLAQGVGYLGSGDVSSLAANQPLQKLLVMADKNYGSYLTGGLDAKNVNTLLENVVKLTQSIADRSDNRIILSEYAKLFGMEVADLRAISNLTKEDINQISESTPNYEQLRGETYSQVSSLGSRMMLKNKIDNLLENMMTGIGENIANNAFAYGTWVLTDLVEKATGGIMNIDVHPFGVGTTVSVTQGIKTGIVGLSTLSKIAEMMTGLTNVGKLDIDKFGATTMVTKGRGLAGLPVGVQETTSQVQYVGNEDTSAIFDTSIGASKEQTKTVTGDKRDLSEIIEKDIAGGIETIISILRDTGIVIKSMPFQSNTEQVGSAAMGQP